MRPDLVSPATADTATFTQGTVACVTSYSTSSREWLVFCEPSLNQRRSEVVPGDLPIRCAARVDHPSV